MRKLVTPILSISMILLISAILLISVLITGCININSKVSLNKSQINSSIGEPDNISVKGNISHVIFVAFENNGFNTVMNNGPYFNYLANNYGVVTDYKDLQHAEFCSKTVSLPNYMAITSGSSSWNGVDKCNTDSASWTTDNSKNIFSLVQSAGLGYGSWTEGFDGNYNPKESSCGPNCAVRHVPALFYSIPNDNLKDYSDWDTRYLKGNEIPPNFSFITPNLCNDAHDCDISIADNWLKNTFNLPTLLQKPWTQNSVFIIWFDESESESNGYLVFVSPLTQGRQHTATANPYNLITTIEWLLGLGNTGNNDDPSKYYPMTDLFCKNDI